MAQYFFLLLTCHKRIKLREFIKVIIIIIIIIIVIIMITIIAVTIKEYTQTDTRIACFLFTWFMEAV